MRYQRFRVTLMAFALGLAAVYMTNGLRIAFDEVPVELPEVQSGDVLVVTPASRWEASHFGCRDIRGADDPRLVAKKIFEGREMNLYEGGGYHDAPGFYPVEEQRRIEASVKSARDFIWSHWRQKKRGYLVVFRSGVDAGNDSHIFIEPDRSGNWQITWYCERLYGMGSCPGDVYKMPPIRHVRLKRADEDWQASSGLILLKMTDEHGNDFSL